jgi:RNA polymerase sigma factor (sigma-70 family)
MTADILAAQSGDSEAFTRLVRSHANMVCAIATAIVGDIRAGEEVSQEVFVQAWTGLKNLNNPAAFSGWLRQLTRNRAHDAVRKQARLREDSGVEALHALADPSADVGERIDADHQERAMWHALDTLDPNQREVLVLFYREGQSVRQVATLLEVAEATVRKRLSRARQELREETQIRLSTRLAQSAPGASFVAGVSAALAIAAPSSAHAATGGLAVIGLKGLFSGALLGGSLGLAGVWFGYRQAARSDDEVLKARVRRIAIAQGLAVVFASLCFIALPPVPGTLIGMPVLVAVMGATIFALGRPNLGGMLGLFGGCASGLAGAALGLHFGGVMDGWLAAALLVQMVCFLSVPLAAGFAVSQRFGIQLRWWFAGALGWILAAPFLAMGGPIASWLAGPTPLAGAVGLSVAAGVFEETSRYGLYRLIHRFHGPLEGHRAVVLGLGHGGVEALLFGLGALAWILSGADTLDPSSHALFGLSRLPLMLIHVGFTLLIWRAIREHSALWWLVAVVAHIGLDLAAFASPIVFEQAGMWPGALLIVGMAGVSMQLIRHALHGQR